MILKTFEYSQYKNKPNEWQMEEFELGNINLIVGKNASGKSMTLNAIRSLADLISGDKKFNFASGNYYVVFGDGKQEIKYSLHYEDYKIIKEILKIDDKTLLERGSGGKGTIYSEQFKQDMDFKIDEKKLVSAVKKDSAQHPFLDGLYKWGKTVHFYPFGKQLGKDVLFMSEKEALDKYEQNINLKNSEAVILFLKKGIDKYGDSFKDGIKNEMKLIGYELSDIGIDYLPGKKIGGQIPTGLFVKETDLKDKTYQDGMSDGMFSALSLIIQINFSLRESQPSCIVIDDVGEGLDFDRSSNLIKLLIDKAKKSSIQLLMSTNDKFVMNNVPLEYWSIIKRTGGKCEILNYTNSKKIFDDFKFTGLNNFDFLSSDFYINGLKK